METAELPAHALNVLPATGAKPAAGAPATEDNTPSTGVLAPAAAPSSGRPIPLPSSLRIWQTLAALGFVLWLITLALWWRARRAGPAVRVAASLPPHAGSSAQRAAFLRACALGELAGAERALVAWARSERPDVRNLGELAVRLDSAAQTDALAALQRARYAGASTQGIGTALERAFKAGLAWRKPAAPATQKSPLPALYPE
jgi:hypothetical protein